MLSQSHTAPFPLRASPVLWAFDAALALFPQPDVLVVAEPGAAMSVTVHDVQCGPPPLLPACRPCHLESRSCSSTDLVEPVRTPAGQRGD